MTTRDPEVDLKREVFLPVAARIRDRAESLRQMMRFGSCGIEGWFKVEAVAALGEKIVRLRNKGPDLQIKIRDHPSFDVELKAATDLNAVYIRQGSTKYNVPCMFLGNGGNPQKIAHLATGGIVRLLAYEVFSDGMNTWVVGIVTPEHQSANGSCPD